MSVYRARYKVHGRSIEALKEELGASDSEAFRKFIAHVSAIVEFFVANGGRGVRVLWQNIDKIVVSILRREQLSTNLKIGQYWEYNYYVSIHGCPETNGKGHKVTSESGIKEVLVPAPPIREV